MKLQRMRKDKLDNMSIEEIIESGTQSHATHDVRVPVTEKNIIEFNKKVNKLKNGYFDSETKNLVDDKFVKVNWGNEEEVKKYVTMTADEVNKYRGGTCYDIVTYENKYINKFFIHPTYKCFFHYILARSKADTDDTVGSTHTFLLLYHRDSIYWLESFLKKKKGVYKFNTEKDALTYIKDYLYAEFTKDTMEFSDKYQRPINTYPHEYQPDKPELTHITYRDFLDNVAEDGMSNSPFNISSLSQIQHECIYNEL